MLIFTCRTIKLTQGKVAVIDRADYHLVKGRSWCAVHRRDNWHAAAGESKGGKQRTVLMHNVILGVKHVDHKDGNGLNNRRSNLRPATQSQNCKNRSKKKAPSSSIYKGVGAAFHGKWVARIMADYKMHHLGYFDDPIEAAKAYDTAAKMLHGVLAKLHFPA
jgi:hypothetical protein